MIDPINYYKKDSFVADYILEGLYYDLDFLDKIEKRGSLFTFGERAYFTGHSEDIRQYSVVIIREIYFRLPIRNGNYGGWWYKFNYAGSPYISSRYHEVLFRKHPNENDISSWLNSD